MTPKKRPQKFPTPNLPDLVTIVDPEVYFEAQYYFQQFGIVLVDLTTGQPIKGQVNLPEIGMILPNPNPKPRKPFGFIPPLESQTNATKFTRQNVDAILGREHIEQEVGQPQQITIQVVDHAFLESWADLANKIANIMTVRGTRETTPRIIFGITSLCSPDEDDDQDITKNIVLSQIQGYGFNEDVNLVSGSHYTPSDDFFDEDEDDYEEE